MMMVMIMMMMFLGAFLRKHECTIFLDSDDSQILQKAEYNRSNLQSIVGQICPLNYRERC